MMIASFTFVPQPSVPDKRTGSSISLIFARENACLLYTSGRVLGVTAKGKDLKEARANAYKATEWIDFANKYMRHDIGHAIDEA